MGLSGGIALIAYILFMVLEYCWSARKFQDYMASELYYTPEDVLAMEGAGGKVDNKGVSGKRSFINRNFHNEIIGEHEKTLNKAKVNMCCRALSCMSCCCKSNRSERLFRKARVYNEQELNVTSIIKA